MVLVGNERQNNKKSDTNNNNNNNNPTNNGNNNANNGDHDDEHDDDYEYNENNDEEGSASTDFKVTESSSRIQIDDASILSTTIMPRIITNVSTISLPSMEVIPTVLLPTPPTLPLSSIPVLETLSKSINETVDVHNVVKSSSKLNDLTAIKLQAFNNSFLETLPTSSSDGESDENSDDSFKRKAGLSSEDNERNNNDGNKCTMDDQIAKVVISMKENCDNLIAINDVNNILISANPTLPALQVKKEISEDHIFEVVSINSDNKDIAFIDEIRSSTNIKIEEGKEELDYNRLQPEQKSKFHNNINGTGSVSSNILKILSMSSINSKKISLGQQQHQQIIELNGGTVAKESTSVILGNISGATSLDSLLRNEMHSIGVNENTSTTGVEKPVIPLVGGEHSDFFNEMSIGTLTANDNECAYQEHITKQLFHPSIPFAVPNLITGSGENNKNNTTTTISSNNISKGTPTSASSVISIIPTSTTESNANEKANGLAKIVLLCEDNSHPFHTRSISLTPNVECMVGRLIAKGKAADDNAIFDCKVLSRKHAVIWYTNDGKFWVKDTKSSNGTFVNDTKLGENEIELHFGDIVKFGVDVLENSRKEVHGCIIACIKLYLPDGREAASIASKYQSFGCNNRPYSAESRINLLELHRLNQYVQETAEREKLLTSKLCSIQNILDATRKNTALCWQAMISEDQLLHRIHSLEKKLQIMEKNVPENSLKNEVIKLLNEKSTYQNTAKEALRKVYQERCDAMHVLAKVESAYTISDKECILLREQLVKWKQALKDLNQRFYNLESEYNDYREEIARKQVEAKEKEKHFVQEFTNKLHLRELECVELKRKVSDLLIKQANVTESKLDETDQQMLEKTETQVIKNFDALLAENDEENNSLNLVVQEDFAIKSEAAGIDENHKQYLTSHKGLLKLHNKHKYISKINSGNNHEEYIDNGTKNITTMEKSSKEYKKKKYGLLKEKHLEQSSSPPERVNESTIMKWLHNSDIYKSEDGNSFDVFRAICNNNDDEAQEDYLGSDVVHNGGDDDDDEIYDKNEILPYDMVRPDERLYEEYTNFANKLNDVQRNIQQLETEVEVIENQLMLLTEDGDKFDIDKKERNIEKMFLFTSATMTNVMKKTTAIDTSANCGNAQKVLLKCVGCYRLLKNSIFMFREAYNEVRQTIHNQIALKMKREKQFYQKINEEVGARKMLTTILSSDESAPLPISLKLNEEKLYHDNANVQTGFQSSTATCNNNKNRTIMSARNKSLNHMKSNDGKMKLLENASGILKVEGNEVYEMEDDAKSTSTSSSISSTPTTVRNLRTSAVTTTTVAESERIFSNIKSFSNTLKQESAELRKIEYEVINKKSHEIHIARDVTNPEKISNQTKSKGIDFKFSQMKDQNKNIIVQHSNSYVCDKDPSIQDICNNDVYYEKLSNDDEESINSFSTTNSDAHLMNLSATEREEELIVYKERLEEQEKENIRLRNEIAKLLENSNFVDINKPISLVTNYDNNSSNNINNTNWVRLAISDFSLREFLPYSIILILIIALFVESYF